MQILEENSVEKLPGIQMAWDLIHGVLSTCPRCVQSLVVRGGVLGYELAYGSLKCALQSTNALTLVSLHIQLLPSLVPQWGTWDGLRNGRSEWNMYLSQVWVVIGMGCEVTLMSVHWFTVKHISVTHVPVHIKDSTSHHQIWYTPRAHTQDLMYRISSHLDARKLLYRVFF